MPRWRGWSLLIVAVATLAGVSREVQGDTTANPEVEKQDVTIRKRWAKGLPRLSASA